MRNLGAVWWLSAVLVWSACDSSKDTDAPAVTRTVFTVDADSGLKRMASKLHVRIESDGEQRLDREYERALWPQNYRLEPRDGDASRSFELLAEAFDAEGERLASHSVKTGFVANETRYARIVLSKCSQPQTDEVEPTILVENQALASAISSECGETPAAGSGGSGGMSGMIGTGGRRQDAGRGGQGGMSGSAGEPKLTGGAGASGASAGTGGSAGGDAESCGDGHLNASEFCDTGIMTGKQGACPNQCETQDHCNPGKLVGKDCQARCEYTKITEAVRDDMCCPAGVSASADNDCKANCGNSMVEAGETCDPPSNCGADKLCGMAPACTMAVLKGDAQQCAVTCSFQPIQVCTSGDGCCPNGCSRPADTDCPVACGDGTVDTGAGETCEPNSATPCPKSCDDADACTTDVSTGSATTCNLACWHTKILTVTNSDGCCPSSANANNDNDCKTTCGNNVVESGEQCDGNCPADAAACNDSNPCTKDSLSGSACQRRCTHTQATASTTSDGCCPSGATSANDADCGSTTNTNLLAGKAFSSSLSDSTVEQGHPVRYMTDNDDTTRFISTPESPITLTADLGASYTLQRIEIIWAGDTIQNFTLGVSATGQTWTTIFTGTTRNLTIDSETYTSFSTTPTGRYLRITGMDRREETYGNSIWEVRAYGK